jgi:hypothetical protein
MRSRRQVDDDVDTVERRTPICMGPDIANYTVPGIAGRCCRSYGGPEFDSEVRQRPL